MTVIMDNDIACLQGHCGADDVEALLAAVSGGGRLVDISEVDHLHAAVLQILLAFRPVLLGSPRDTFVRTWLIPTISPHDGSRPPITPSSAGSSEQQMTTTILIVDDSKLARIVAGKAVSALQPDWQRVEAGNADEALALVGKTKIDVALVDFNMPGKNGVELAGELRLSRPSMPIALITANLQTEVVESAKAIRAVFVAKPVTAEGLQKFLADAAQALSDENV